MTQYRHANEGMSRIKCIYPDCHFQTYLTTYTHSRYIINTIRLLTHNILHKLFPSSHGYYFESADMIYYKCRDGKILEINSI